MTELYSSVRKVISHLAPGGPAREVRPITVRARWLACQWGCLVGVWVLAGAMLSGQPVTFVFTSDLHYGINRGNFRGAVNVESQVVNAALARKLNGLPVQVLPKDEGLRAGEPVGPIAFVVVTGDIANRQELYPIHIQSASVSWRQFADGFIKTLALKDAGGHPTPLFLVPGNHDVSNAIGSPSKLVPERDATAAAEIYNHMMSPAVPRTKDTYRYETDKVFFSKDFGGAHCIFLTMWPDRVARAWIEQDLRSVSAETPVFLFCHDNPDISPKHLTNPNGKNDVNPRDKFENVVADVAAAGSTIKSPSIAEQRALASFLKAHPNIVGYFHGHSNYNEFYTWRGPDGDIALNVFRVDSPIKGRDSGKDETKISFQVVTYDTGAKTLTSRECQWNAQGREDTDLTPVAWGDSRTISLAPR